MEVERPRYTSSSLHDEAEAGPSTLPPAPTPFPVELLPQAPEYVELQKQNSLSDLSAVQQSCINTLATLLPDDTVPSWTPHDQQLAAALTDLLEVTYELESLRPSTLAQPLPADSRTSYDDLIRQLAELQARRPVEQGLHPVVNAVRERLAWERVESLSTAIQELVKARDGSNGDGQEALPPSYTQEEHANDVAEEDADRISLPSYHDRHSPPPSLKSRTRHAQQPSITSTLNGNEKMTRELEAVTDAIEKLQAVTPRFQDQRVEMRAGPSRLKQGREGMSERDKMRELEEIWEKIERAHGKGRARGDRQRTDGFGLEGGSRARRERFFAGLVDQPKLAGQHSTMRKVDAELAKARELRDRDYFLRDLVERGESRLAGQDYPISVDAKLAERRENMIEEIVAFGSAGRMHDQDSRPPTPKSALMDLGGEPGEVVTVADFLSGATPGGSRSRSDSVDDKRVPSAFGKIKGLVRKSSLNLGLGHKANDLSGVSYVAEYQENLQCIQVMLHGPGLTLNGDFTLESDGVNATVISKKDPALAYRLTLPVPSTSHQSLTPQDLHLEAKLPANETPSNHTLNTPQALSASELRWVQPEMICCAGCDRDLADVSQKEYKDLPSEHWAEMMEVWMCHADAGFTAGLAEKTRDGFWPTTETVLVGASYLLVDAKSVYEANLKVDEGPVWQVVSCKCGEVLGKQRAADGKPGAGTVRFAKWAISLVQEEDIPSLRYPLPVFVVADMLELAQAHASYRFVVTDEEFGERRLLMWLFTPSLRISYRKAASSSPLPSPLRASFIQRRSSASILSRRTSAVSLTTDAASSMTKVLRVAKIMYKVLDSLDGPEAGRLSGFGPGGQVETLVYPQTVCARLINALRESTAVYPAARRSMGGFDVGFLERI